MGVFIGTVSIDGSDHAESSVSMDTGETIQCKLWRGTSKSRHRNYG